jgi:L,D-peptidoglycan transpeptidase YkuD (ErfK/YbiS/YcfS/YnhG family)
MAACAGSRASPHDRAGLRLPVALLAASVLSCAQKPEGLLLSGETLQLLLVRTPDWTASDGILRRYERDTPGGSWRRVGDPRPVTVGRAGLGWATPPLHAFAGPEKREGDGRSPAGVFPLGVAFGSASREEARWIGIPYLPLAPGTECVDDPASSHYNSIVDRASTPRPDWNSSERMLEVGEAYRLGIFVGHNVAPARAGLGSCIFLHLWSGAPAPTAGCTAMSRESMEETLRWLRPSPDPILVQLPEDALARLRLPLPD